MSSGNASLMISQELCFLGSLPLASSLTLTPPASSTLNHKLNCVRPANVRYARRRSYSSYFTMTTTDSGVNANANSESGAEELNGAMYNTERKQLYPYVVPSFVEQWDAVLKHAPKHRLKLVMGPTPIHPFDAPLIHRKDISLFVKRDDLTGISESGNKIRKLEFLLADALAQQYDTVITAGGVQSNHARAVSVLCRQLGLQPHVFLRSTMKTIPSNSDKEQLIGYDGNVLLHRLCQTRIHIIPRMPYVSGILPRMESLRDQLVEKGGKKPYLIGIGGSNHIGVWGYIEAYAEIAKQCKLGQDVTHIVLATGSGGTAAGLAIANFLNHSPVKIVAFTVCDTPQDFYDHVDEMLAALDITSDQAKATDLLTILEAKGKGYGINSEEDLRSVSEIASASGIILDPTYSLKAFRGLVQEVNKDPDSDPSELAFPRGSRILFIHTGGLFGLFDRRVEPFLDTSFASIWKGSEVGG